VQSSNPVLGRLGAGAGRGRFAPAGAGIQRPGYGTQQYGGYDAGPIVDRTGERMMTIDDVVTRTVMLIAVTGIFGAGAWLLLPDGAATGAALLGSSLAGLVLGLVIAFARITNPFLITAYAAVQGVLLGVVSRWYESLYSGIVIQAVVGTFGVFFGMAMLYKFRVLRATPRFTRFVIGALIGVVALSLVNWIAYLFGANLGLVSYNPGEKVGLLPIVFVLVCIGVGALTFILDFAVVEDGIRQGLPEKFAWYCSFGLLVGLIFLYWQILRLLGYLRR
jgi:uncharacterized YccA/Bax inhibitor family protein